MISDTEQNFKLTPVQYMDLVRLRQMKKDEEEEEE